MHNDFYGNKFSWFVGVVREVLDETYVRVRVFGIHPTFDLEAVPDSDLPLALVVYPVTGDQVNSGAATHNLAVDSWVTGFFSDYPYCQQPIVTGVIQGTTMSMSNYKSNGGQFVGQGTESGETGTAPELDPSASVNLPGGSNGEKAYNFIREKLRSSGAAGDHHMLASAWVGGMMAESGQKINPAVVNGIGAWGICQWLGPRKKQLFAKYGRTKRLDHQLDFMWWEMNNTEVGAKNAWLASTNMADAVAAMSKFERAEDHSRRGVNRNHNVYRSRFKLANGVYNTLKGAPSS